MSQQSPGTENGGGAEGRKSVPLLGVVKSIAAAAFGVQSSRNREADFTHGNYRHFIVGGIIFTVIFVLTVAFKPELLGKFVSPGSSMLTVGVLVELLMFILFWILTAVYVRRANTEFDALNQQIINDAVKGGK